MKSWSQKYDEKDLAIIVEASTHCNAKCPQCSRTERWGLGKSTIRDYELNSWSIDDFKSYFSEEDLNHMKNIHFSGTYGDPGMCKDIFEIIDYIFKVSPKIKVSMNSNGSMRDEEWWYALGSLAPERLLVSFDVDGINQEMHEKYRRGTNLQKVLNNMQAYALSGADVKTLTIIFKHNQDYYDEIKNMVKNYGCFNSRAIESNRFSKAPIWEFQNEHGEIESLEQTDNPRFLTDQSKTSRRNRDWKLGNITETYDYIVCTKAVAGTLQILNTGQVYPCCYLGTVQDNGPFERFSIWDENKERFSIWDEYINGNFNLKNKSLKEIINDKWYTHSLFESLKDKSKTMLKCKRFCGYRSDEKTAFAKNDIIKTVEIY